jgi:hypothetical protein
MTPEDKPESECERIESANPSPSVTPLETPPATTQNLLRLAEKAIVFNASHNQNVTINIIQVTQATNYVHIVQQMPEFQALPEVQQEKVLATVGELEEAVKGREPGFLKSCLKRLLDEGKELAAGIIAKLILHGMTGRYLEQP